MGVRIYEAASELHVTIGSDDDQFGGRSCRRSVIYGLRPPSRLRSSTPVSEHGLRIILALIAKGLTNSAIAERLGLSGKTVANYVSVILAKIDAADRNEARQKVTSLQTDPVGRC
jgi:ATP/maltotriose-dependent transcriptional regulator MalT